MAVVEQCCPSCEGNAVGLCAEGYRGAARPRSARQPPAQLWETYQVVLNCHLVNSEEQRGRERKRGSLCEGVCAFDCVIVCMCLSVCEYVHESEYM